jgi:CDP-paratose 2-epimerase
MHILITGACGFVGSSLCRTMAEAGLGWTITGFDNLGRRGSEMNRPSLQAWGVNLIHGDLRCPSDVAALPRVDWIIDCAANASVLAGADGLTSSRQLMEHNLSGTINLLEKCRADHAGFVLLSTSRVYSIPPLAALEVEVHERAYRPVFGGQGATASDPSPAQPISTPGPGTKNQEHGTKNNFFGLSPAGITESFTTASPVSLYGASKLASETLALEYGGTFDFPVWINRCGVMAGAGQFGRPDQGIFAYWINAHLRRRPLRYLGFGGQGHQVRDCLHPRDLLPLLVRQMSHHIQQSTRNQESGTKNQEPGTPNIVNISGGIASAQSLRQLTDWCDDRFGPHEIIADGRPRSFDLPWVVLDHALASRVWNWQPATPVEDILQEIATHAEANPHWLEATGA